MSPAPRNPFEVKKILHEKKTDHHEIKIYEACVMLCLQNILIFLKLCTLCTAACIPLYWYSLNNNCTKALLKYRMDTDYGKVLMIDGAVWDAELSKFSYQKMMNVLPIKSHPNPRKVSFVSYYLNEMIV